MCAVKKVKPSLQKGAEGMVDLRPVHWDDIGGLDDVKLQIQQVMVSSVICYHSCLLYILD